MCKTWILVGFIWRVESEETLVVVDFETKNVLAYILLPSVKVHDRISYTIGF